MDYMFKYFHKHFDNVEDEYKKRIDCPTTNLLSYTITPYNYHLSYPLYFLPTLSIINKVEQILKLCALQTQQYNKLPAVANKSFYNDLIISEINLTHKIEGVRSSKKEIRATLSQLNQINDKKKIRFKSIIRTYQKIQSNSLPDLPKMSQDIRLIYDDITDGEIEDKNMLDSHLFRLDDTVVTTVTDKIIHRGVKPHYISKDIQYLLDFMNNNKDVHLVIKVAIFHYIFGYIHPFYDGNGRTNRYITSLFLAHYYNEITALSLTTAINNNKKRYEIMFDKTNSNHNKGELNYFVDNFLDLLIEGQEMHLVELNKKAKLLDISKLWLKQKNLPKIQNDIIFILIQAKLFNYDQDVYLSLQEITKYVKYSEQTIRKNLKTLESYPFIETIGQKPKRFALIDNFTDL